MLHWCSIDILGTEQENPLLLSAIETAERSSNAVNIPEHFELHS